MPANLPDLLPEFSTHAATKECVPKTPKGEERYQRDGPGGNDGLKHGFWSSIDRQNHLIRSYCPGTREAMPILSEGACQSAVEQFILAEAIWRKGFDRPALLGDERHRLASPNGSLGSINGIKGFQS